MSNPELHDQPSAMGLAGRFAAQWRRRHWWMNLMWYFCLYMTFVYLPYDLFIKPVAEDREVWFGFMLEGWAAKSHGAPALGDLRRRRVRLLEDAPVDVAVGGALCRADRGGHGGVGAAVSRR